MSDARYGYFSSAVVSPAEFQKALEGRERAKLAKLGTIPARQLTDSEVRARIEYLKTDNARMRALLNKHAEEAERARIEFLKKDNARMREIIERRAQAAANQMMRQLLKSRQNNRITE